VVLGARRHFPMRAHSTNNQRSSAPKRVIAHRALRAGMMFAAVMTFAATGWGQYVVDFEGASETKTGYASGNVTLSGIQWNMTEALIGTEVGERISGSRTARGRGYGDSAMTMNADKSGGIGTISLKHRRYGTDTQVSWRVEYSTNGGST